MLAVPDYSTRECIIGQMVPAMRGIRRGYMVKLERFPHWTFYVDAENGDDAVRLAHAELDRDGIPYMSGKNGSTFQRLG